MNYQERIHAFLDGIMDEAKEAELLRLAADNADIREELRNAMTLQSAFKSLELLDNDYREALILREYDGFSYQEIAEITRTSEVNARTRVFRAKQHLRTILQPYFNDVMKHR